MLDFKATGTPLIKLEKGQVSTAARKGYMHCGCYEDDVLMEFIFWKTWTITSPTTKVTEGWLDQHMDPRTRHFVVKAFKEASKLELEDFYKEGGSLDKEGARMETLKVQIGRLSAELATLELKAKQGEEEEEEEETSLLEGQGQNSLQ